MIQRPIEEILERPRNIPPPHGEGSTRVRGDTHTLGALLASIKKHGLVNAITIDKNNQVIDGNKRLSACKELGHKTIAVHIIPNYIYLKACGWVAT